MTLTAPAPEDAASTPPPSRWRGSGEFTLVDQITRTILFVAALLPTLALAFLAYEMIKSAYPAIIFNGTKFFTTKTFSLGSGGYSGGTIVHHGYKAEAGAHFGILPLIFGTLVSSLIALVIAVPVSVGGAILLVEKLPRSLANGFGLFLELLAGIPSVIFGLWGLYAFGPLVARDVYKPLSDLGIPYFTKTPGSGQGMLTASLVLSVMIIPIIASTTRELVRSVPQLTKEGAVALGLTGSESVRLVTMPFVRTGVLAAAFLGWGRALGETIAVLLISGNSIQGYPQSIFAPFATMASTIASLLDGALTDTTGMAVHSLAEIGLVLLVITMLTNFAGRLIADRLSGTGLPVGRGI